MKAYIFSIIILSFFLEAKGKEYIFPLLFEIREGFPRVLGTTIPVRVSLPSLSKISPADQVQRLYSLWNVPASPLQLDQLLFIPSPDQNPAHRICFLPVNNLDDISKSKDETQIYEYDNLQEDDPLKCPEHLESVRHLWDQAFKPPQPVSSSSDQFNPSTSQPSKSLIPFMIARTIAIGMGSYFIYSIFKKKKAYKSLKRKKASYSSRREENRL